MIARSTYLAALSAASFAAFPALAASPTCQIEADGALTVSGTPGGAAFSQIAAGASVTREELARDGQNRSWYFIKDAATGRRLGWVPAGNLRCR